jgi:hypothetical protein
MAAQTKQKNRVGTLAHSNAGEGYVLNDGAVDAFECKTRALVENAVGDSNVLEAAAQFRNIRSTPNRYLIRACTRLCDFFLIKRTALSGLLLMLPEKSAPHLLPEPHHNTGAES